MIEMPSVRNILREQNRKVRYEVFAYRTMTEAELREFLWAYFSQPRVKKPRRDTVIQIMSSSALLS